MLGFTENKILSHDRSYVSKNANFVSVPFSLYHGFLNFSILFHAFMYFKIISSRQAVRKSLRDNGIEATLTRP